MNVPLVTPRGNPGNEGVVVATPTLPGGAIQQWICAALIGATRFWKVALTTRLSAAASKTTVVKPVPGEALEGFSYKPLARR